MSSDHTFKLENMRPQAVCNGGTRTIANADNFPILKDISLYFLRLESKGIREPHWHPNAAELSYSIEGRALMTIFGPGDNIDTFEVGPGEIVFIPPAYFHYIENLSNSEDMQFAIFFLRMKDPMI
jgi:oxalate decarboxylase